MKTKYDWVSVNSDINYIFTDQDGDVFESDFKPLNVGTGWRGTGYCSWQFSMCEPFKGDWKDSLEERPNEFN